MKIYLAGPMRGYPEFNFPAFDHAANMLRLHGHEVFSPAENDRTTHGADFGKGNKEGDEEKAAQAGFSLREALEADTSWICRHADTIAMLPGWDKSKGARAELALAEALNLSVLFLGKAFTK